MKVIHGLEMVKLDADFGPFIFAVDILFALATA